MQALTIVAVTGPLGQGAGAIAPETPLDDAAAQAHAEKVSMLVEKTNPDAPNVCFDGRGADEMLDGSEVLPGDKSGGGIVTSGLASLETSGFFKDDDSALMHVAVVTSMLEAAGHRVGFHTSDKQAAALKEALLKIRQEVTGMGIEAAVAHIESLEDVLQGTSCGAADNLASIIAMSSSIPQEINGQLETAEQVAARLDSHFGIINALAKEPYTREDFDAQVAANTALVQSGKLDGWSSVKMFAVVDAVLVSRGVAGGILSRIQVLKDDGKGVHGHNEGALDVVKQAGVTIETGRILAETGQKDFVLNTSVADKLTSTFMHPSAELAFYSFQDATRMFLTNGQQRANIYS